MNSTHLLDGWYFKNGSNTLGPVSARELRELLDTGRLHPRQPVWHRQSQRSLFVRAEKAAQTAQQWRHAS